MSIINFVLSHLSDITLIFGVIGAIIVFVRHGEIKVLRNVGLSFVTEAERLYGSRSGMLKKSVVLEWLYDKIPSVLKPFFSESALGELIDDIILPAAKEYWEKNPVILEYINGVTMDDDINEEV